MNKKPSEPITSIIVEAGTNLGATIAQQARLHSKELFRTAHEIALEHAGNEYRLRLTRQGKLILTK